LIAICHELSGLQLSDQLIASLFDLTLLSQHRDPNLAAGDWLGLTLERYESNREGRELLIPHKSDGTGFLATELQGDQRRVLGYVLYKLYVWMQQIEKEDVTATDLQPLRMTIMGAAGTGKSVLVNCLVTLLRQMFQSTDSVFVGAPTGSAAFKAFGETIHRLFCVPVRSNGGAEIGTVSGVTQGLLMARFRRPIAGIFDERSLISLATLGHASHNFRQTAYDGLYFGDDAFCDIPLLLLVGDDYQLPPVSRGAFDIPLSSHMDDARIGHFAKAEYLGMEIFRECAQDVMVLTKKKRQSDDQQEYQRILDDARTSSLSMEDADQLLDELHLTRGNYTQQDRESIEKDALFISANREPVDEYNFRRLATICSEENPVAIIRSITKGRKGEGVSSHFDSGCPSTAHLCIGAKVSLQGRNFNPAWGLFNGSIGVVQEIVFSPGANPNDGDQPLYVVVEFNSYCGPVWDTKHPKVSSRDWTGERHM
jgi:hypothetical protein